MSSFERELRRQALHGWRREFRRQLRLPDPNPGTTEFLSSLFAFPICAFFEATGMNDKKR